MVLNGIRYQIHSDSFLKEAVKHVFDLCSFATLMVYKIPMEDVKSLAKSFAQLESGKM